MDGNRHGDGSKLPLVSLNHDAGFSGKIHGVTALATVKESEGTPSDFSCAPPLPIRMIAPPRR
jgi:hypothetical protein